MKTEYTCTFLMVVLCLTVPWLAGAITPQATLACLMAGCVVLSLVAGLFGKTRARVLVPVTVAVAFLCTAPFFYDETVLIWALWLGIVSAVCVAVGWGISALLARGRAKGVAAGAGEQASEARPHAESGSQEEGPRFPGGERPRSGAAPVRPPVR